MGDREDVKVMRSGDLKSDRKQVVSRRQYAQLLAGSATAGLAGCLGVLEAEAGLEDDTEGYEPPDTITVAVDNTPEQSNLNEWTDDRRIAGVEYLTELAAPQNSETSEFATSGTEFDADWIEERQTITIPAMLADFEVETPDTIVETYDDRLEYWDGTPLDANAMYLHDKLFWYDGSDGANAVLSDMTFEAEVVDDWTYRRTVDSGSAPVLESMVYRLERVPLHPDFTQPYHERLEDASNEDAAAEIVQELREETLTINDLVENQWGSGLYRVESLEDVTEDGLVAHRDESHPNEHASIDRLEVLWASPDQQEIANQRGRIDIGGGVIEDSGDTGRSSLPDYVQEVDRFTSPSGDKLLFNWNNTHLENLWVRRAIVALVDWTAVRREGWGTGSVAIEHDTGLHSSVSERYFEEDFLGDLHQYPREYDVETALDWLQRAGYTGSRSDGWTSPDGEPLELTITVNEAQSGHVRGGRTIQGNLESAGIDAELSMVPQEPGLSSALGRVDPSFDLAILWDDFGNPWDYYATNGDWWASTLVGGAPDAWWTLPETDYGEVDNYGVPLEPEIPSQPGSIDAPNQAGLAPSLAGGERIELPTLVHNLPRPDTDQATFDEYVRKCARFYNYYLPQFLFHSTEGGLWGNRRDFEFPAKGNSVNRIAKGVYGSQDYQVMAGIPQPSPDPSFPSPDA